MKILFVSAEVAPFSSVGGLSQVSYFLPKSLKRLGYDVRIFSAKYGVIDGSGGSMPVKKTWPMKLEYEGLRVPIENDQKMQMAEKAKNSPAEQGPASQDNHSDHFLVCNVKSSRASRYDPLVYFLENHEYFEMRANVYQYSDDHVRFALLSKGCLEWLLKLKDEGRRTKDAFSLQPSDPWFPDVIHLNDWHTAGLAEMIKTDPRYKALNIPVLLTIHNFSHQGNGSYDFRFAPKELRDRGEDPLPSLLDPKLIEKNVLVRGIKYADSVNTVSKTHAEEVLTSEYGEGIEDVLNKYKDKLSGILNGLDTKEFNPQTDSLIKYHFSLRSLNRRAENKAVLQREFKLPRKPGVPLLAISGRMDRQKGLDLMAKSLPKLLANFDFQLVILGGGDENFRQFFMNLANDYPDRVVCHLRPSFSLPRKIFAGADLILMPSKFEPGGIVALEALRYGCVPLVRRTGGLNDIIEDFNPQDKTGNGFSFTAYDPWAFYGAVVAALTTYRDHDCWRRLVGNCLREDFSWDHSAREYEELYRSLLK